MLNVQQRSDHYPMREAIKTDSEEWALNVDSLNFRFHHELKLWKDRQQLRDMCTPDMLRAVDDSWHVELVVLDLYTEALVV